MRQLNFIYVLGLPALSTWQNNEFRYSLRSIAQFKPNWVGVAGPALPPFTCGLARIYCNPHESSRYRNVQRQLLEACNSPDVPEDLILMNDDFIVRGSPIWDWRSTHMGLIPQMTKPNQWKQTIEVTGQWLKKQSVYEALNYEGHTPFPFKKSKMKPILEALLQESKVLQLRTAYGNMLKIGGVLHPNAKRDDPDKWPDKSPFWSLKGTPSPKAIAYLEKNYSKPSPWEAPNV